MSKIPIYEIEINYKSGISKTLYFYSFKGTINNFEYVSSPSPDNYRIAYNKICGAGYDFDKLSDFDKMRIVEVINYERTSPMIINPDEIESIYQTGAVLVEVISEENRNKIENYAQKLMEE